MTTVAERVWELVAGYGVKDVFYLPGGGAMFLNDALVRQQIVRPVCLLHEHSCAVAAEGYAKYTGGIGVACVTSGPGGTNAVSGCASCWVGHTPVLFVSGQVSTHQMARDGQRQGGPQELPITKIVRPVTKYAITLTKPVHVDWWLKTLVALANKIPQGPVWLDIPLDIQSARI